MYKSKFVIALIVLFLVVLYFQPWNIVTNRGTMYVLICAQQYESDSVWEYRTKDSLNSNELVCDTSSLSTLRLNFKVFINQQKVVFSAKEIGVVSYNCNVYDRNNFMCPEKDLGVERGRPQLYYNRHEVAVPKWRYWQISFNLLIDKIFGRTSVYKLV